MVWRLYVKLRLIFILYLIIELFTQFSLLISYLIPSEEHSALFANYPTSLLWDSSEILYSLLRIPSIIINTTPTGIYPIISAFSAVWNISDPIEEKLYNKFFLIIYRSQYILEEPINLIINYPITPHQKTLLQFIYCHPKSVDPKSVHFLSPPNSIPYMVLRLARAVTWPVPAPVARGQHGPSNTATCPV